MNQYFFVLGTNHSLCKIDIINSLLKIDPELEVLEASSEILVIQTKKTVDCQKLITNLGSAIKIGLIFKTFSHSGFTNQLVSEAKNKKFNQFFNFKPGKHLAISVYDGGAGFKTLNKTFFSSKKISKILKNEFNLKLITDKSRKLPSFLVDKTNLLSDGSEMVLLTGKKGVYLGKTLEIQDYQGYSQRDYGRPQRDSRLGMISPKLAKIMINLAGKNKDKVFLDPFCGAGTFLQELVLLGYKNINGADIEQKQVDSARKNLDWLFLKLALKKDSFNINIFKSDVREISKKLPPSSIDAIVSEPFLGSPKVKHFSLKETEKEIEKLNLLYMEAFTQFAKILKDKAIAVIIFPVFKKANRFFYLEVLSKINSLGFLQKEFLAKKPKGSSLLNLKITKRGSIIFFHTGQTVSREVFVFEKK